MGRGDGSYCDARQMRALQHPTMGDLVQEVVPLHGGSMGDAPTGIW